VFCKAIAGLKEAVVNDDDFDAAPVVSTLPAITIPVYYYIVNNGFIVTTDTWPSIVTV